MAPIIFNVFLGNIFHAKIASKNLAISSLPVMIAKRIMLHNFLCLSVSKIFWQNLNRKFLLNIFFLPKRFWEEINDQDFLLKKIITTTPCIKISEKILNLNYPKNFRGNFSLNCCPFKISSKIWLSTICQKNLPNFSQNIFN